MHDFLFPFEKYISSEERLVIDHSLTVYHSQYCTCVLERHQHIANGISLFGSLEKTTFIRAFRMLNGVLG
jgi:hypothetical protein